MIDVANIALRAAALGAAALCLVWSYAEAGRFGGPGIGGGLSHMGAAMSIHAPGGGEFRGFLAHHQIVSRAVEGNEIEVKCLGGGAGSEAGIGVARDDAIGGGEMAVGDAIVSGDFVGGHGGGGEQLVK